LGTSGLRSLNTIRSFIVVGALNVVWGPLVKGKKTRFLPPGRRSEEEIGLKRTVEETNSKGFWNRGGDVKTES